MLTRTWRDIFSIIVKAEK